MKYTTATQYLFNILIEKGELTSDQKLILEKSMFWASYLERQNIIFAFMDGSHLLLDKLSFNDKFEIGKQYYYKNYKKK